MTAIFPDTSPVAEAVPINLMRQTPPWRTLDMVDQMNLEVSDREWQEILSMLKFQADRSDLEYLYQWAVDLKVDDLLTQNIKESP